MESFSSKKCIILILAALVCSSCAKLAHLDQLLTIKGYSENKDAQEQYVIERNKKFEELLKVAKVNGLEKYPSQDSLVKDFGPPVIKRKLEKDNATYQEWIYRYETKYFDSEKIYVYFDNNGNLKDWELFVPSNSNSKEGSENE